jgi:hypothetical protein
MRAWLLSKNNVLVLLNAYKNDDQRDSTFELTVSYTLIS